MVPVPPPTSTLATTGRYMGCFLTVTPHVWRVQYDYLRQDGTASSSPWNVTGRVAGTQAEQAFWAAELLPTGSAKDLAVFTASTLAAAERAPMLGGGAPATGVAQIDQPLFSFVAGVAVQIA